MKSISILSLFLLIPGAFAFSQRVVDVKYDQDAQGNYSFSYNNKAWCPYMHGINFTSMENAKSDHPLPFLADVKPGSGKLFKLSKITAADPIQLKYKTRSFKGCLNPVVDTAFTYLLPVAPGKEAQAYE